MPAAARSATSTAARSPEVDTQERRADAPVEVIAIVGPTAAGKSDLALALAEALGGPYAVEIVNADAFQLYRGMDIGTAKVPEAERRGIAHHQVDVLDPRDHAVVAHYQRAARADVAAILRRRRRALVVGGSGLYVRALLDEMKFPGTDSALRAALEERAQFEGGSALHAELGRLDPVAAAAIDPRNVRRTIRALEVVQLTGRPFRASLPRAAYVYPTLAIGLDLSRETLDRRVEARVDRMFGLGLVAEVRGLDLGPTAARAVGYAEVSAHLRGELDEPQTRSAITANTRRLARKQMGWFGRDARIRWLDAEHPELVQQALELVRSPDDYQQPRRTASREDIGGIGGGETLPRRPLGSIRRATGP